MYILLQICFLFANNYLQRMNISLQIDILFCNEMYYLQRLPIRSRTLFATIINQFAMIKSCGKKWLFAMKKIFIGINFHQRSICERVGQRDVIVANILLQRRLNFLQRFSSLQKAQSCCIEAITRVPPIYHACYVLDKIFIIQTVTNIVELNLRLQHWLACMQY